MSGHRADKIIAYEDWQTTPFLEKMTEIVGRKLPDVRRAQGVVPAYINHGRWVVDCPTGDGGAMMVSLENPYFMCPVCHNEANGGQWYKVNLPDEPARRAIERELVRRPAQDGFNATTRNWRPGEAVRDLQDENERMGLGRP